MCPISAGKHNIRILMITGDKLADLTQQRPNEMVKGLPEVHPTMLLALLLYSESLPSRSSPIQIKNYNKIALQCKCVT